MSEDLPPPVEPGGGAGDDQLEILIKNGIRCTTEGFCQYIDYFIIEELKPDFKGEESIFGPFLLEMIPPPTLVVQYIQVHRLNGNENLSHLLLAYHQYGAARAVVFVNTCDESKLHQDLLNTLPAAGEEYSKLLSIVVQKSAGTELVKNISRFPLFRCNIYSTGVHESESFELTELTMVSHPSPAEKEKPPEELDLLIDEMKVCLTERPENFRRAMKMFQVLENKNKFLKFLISVTVSPVVWHLLNPVRFGVMFKIDFPFYVVVAYRLLKKHKLYELRKETLRSFCKLCVEGLYALPPEVLQETLEGFINRGSFDAKFTIESEISVFEILGNGFSKICQIWLKEKPEGIAKCWGVAFLCMSLSMKLYVAGECPVLAEKQWELHVLDNHRKLSWEPKTLHEIKRGFECMRVLRISSGMIFNPRHFSYLLDKQPVIPFSYLEELVVTLQEFCIDSWKTAFLFFMKEMRVKYQTHIFLGRKSTTKYNYSGVSKQESMYNAFEEGWKFMLTVVEFIRTKNWFDRGTNLLTECRACFTMLFNLIDFKDDECIKCVNLVDSTPKDPEFDWIKSINSKFRGSCHKLPVEVFQRIYSTVTFWQMEILERYLNSFKAQVNIVICSTHWQKLLQDVSQCPLRHSQILVKFLMNVGDEYVYSGRASSFIPDLLAVDAPQLFHSTATTSEYLGHIFIQQLTSYIRRNLLRKFLLTEFSSIMAQLPFKEHPFWMLIVLAILEEAFIEINPCDQQDFIAILEVSLQLVHLFLNKDDFVTVRARSVFGALRSICYKIPISEDNLDWFLNNKDLLTSVCHCFKPFYQKVSRDFCADVTEFSRSTGSIEVECFLDFCLRLQRTLKKWKEKVKVKNVSLSDITKLEDHIEEFSCICEIMFIPEASIEEVEIQQILDNCNDIKSKLQNCLIKFVPGLRWCPLSDVLKRLRIPFPVHTQKQIRHSLVIPTHSSAERCKVEQLEFPPQIQLTSRSNMNLLVELLTSLLQFINPLSKYLPAIVFLHIHNCRLFFNYVSYYLNHSLRENTSDYAMKSVKLTTSTTHSDAEVEQVAEAVSLAISLLKKIIDGSATLDEVMINNAIDLQSAESELVVQRELNILMEFVSHGLSANCVIFDASTHGLKCYIELQAIITNIPVVSDVLKQFGLHNCQNSKQYTLLKGVAEQTDNIGSLKLMIIKELLAGVKEILHLKGNSDLSCFKLFQAIKRNAPFYRFAERMGFTGPNGREGFLSRYRMVLAHLQHEEYNQAILHHLYGSYKYISPFFNKEIEFEQLIEEIMQLPNISKGINHLEQVSANIVMIKVWFENVEGETMESVEKTLNAVLHTGVSVFQTDAATGQVHFELKYDPRSLSETDFKIAEGLCISLENEPSQQPADLKREWSIEDMNDHSLKLGFVQCKIQQKDDKSVEVFKNDHERIQLLLRTYQELKCLGHPEYQEFSKEFRSSLEDNGLEKEVMSASKQLHHWKAETEKCRRECAELAFFSNEKVMRILRILQSSRPSSVDLVKEIACLYNSDQETIRKLTLAIQGVICDLPVSVGTDEVNLPVKVVGNFLRSVFAHDFLPPAICLYAANVSPQPTRSHDSLPTTPHGNKFTLHAVHNFTPLQMLQLIFTVFHGVPNSFQIFQCTPDTTEQQLNMFFDRAFHWSGIRYLLLSVNYLRNELQEMLVKKCCDWKIESTCNIHFVEFSQSVLRLIPSVSINEHRDSTRLNYNIDVCLRNNFGVRPKYNKFELVYGHAGNGKSYYIKKELRLYFRDRSVTVALNESFNQLRLIKQLQETVNNDGLMALYLNFTFIQPAESEGDREYNQYKLLSEKINWVFTNLLIFGYLEDVSTGESYRIPCDSQWCVYVEVPSLDEEDPHKSIDKFTKCYPVFDVFGKEKFINSDIPYVCDGQVQLVCKYLKAMKEGTLDQAVFFGNSDGISIGSNVKMLTAEECSRLLNEYMPPHVRQRKISQRLYIRYMYRRCHFLEECPYLKYNQGFAPGVPVKDRRTGKIFQGEESYKDTSRLRSVLFNTMRKEVAYFSEQCIGSMHEKGSQYHQLVYDFQKGEANFTLLSTFSEASDSDELNIQAFRELGFELPSQMQLRKNKQLLHKMLARGLGVPCNPETGHIDLLDDMQYVMTLDFAVKMLTIHERRLCGIPVIIKGETGVGKTFLLETLSALWNHALLTMLGDEREGLKDNLRRDLNDYLLRKTDEKLGEDLTEALESFSGDNKTELATIRYVLGMKVANRNGKFLFDKYLKKLLSLKTDPIFSILELPARIQGYKTFSQLFSTVQEPLGMKETIQVVSQLLYAVLYGEIPKTFYKLSVHSALSPEDIKVFFEPIIKQAVQIIVNFELINPSSEALNQYRHPVITVFLDEINTSSCLGVLQEIVVDKTLDGEELPPNIFIVAACNPYRGDSLASLQTTFDSQKHKPTATATTDGLSQTSGHWFRGSYYVRPLSPTLELLMWDYKALDPSREREFIYSKLSMTLSDADSSDLTEPIVKSQQLIRKYAFDSLISSGMNTDEANDRSTSTVSQRDIQRAFHFFQWLSRLFASVDRYQGEPPLKRKLRALYVALAIVYYFRLDKKCRKNYAQEMNKRTIMGIDRKPVLFSEALRNELDWLIAETTLPPGVAQTEALKENLYATVVCTMTRTPLIIVGAPGSSKTLSFKITVSNLQGLESSKETFRNEAVFHALEPTIYQCSRRSTSTEIESVFKRAIASQNFYLGDRQNCYSVVMMDEAGLPEESHESLKVLHVHLDNQEVAFVGISNHVLDAAKSNRAVSLFRPETSEEDVRELASVCLKDQPGLIDGICRAYMIKMKSQAFRAFYGLRDFIHFFTYLQRRKRNNDEVATPQMIMQAIERNFNGSDQFKSIYECFLKEMGYSYQRVMHRSILSILKHSLNDKPKDLSAENEVRYKLIIDSSEDESVIRFLFTFGVLQRKKTRMYICSKFPGDGETQKINTIAAIRHSALQGHTVILSQSDEIHESFYDLFNQRFTCIDHHQDGKQYYTNIAIGPHVKPSRVDPHFQCVVVIKQSELHCTPAPFLNRFEKYALNHQSLLEDVLDSYPRRLRDLVCTAKKKVKGFLELFEPIGLYGQNCYTLDSLILTIIQPYCHQTVGPSVDHCDVTGTMRLLCCLMSALKTRIGISTWMVSDNLATDAKHVGCNVRRDSHFSASLDGLDENSIPETVDKAIDALLNEDDEVIVSRTICTVTAFLQQWLVTYLCERLMQLMTPETLIANHKKIPRHYINVYLNHQHHFNLKELIGDYQNAQSQKRSIPNKLLCFSRSSPLIHTSFQSPSISGDETNISSPKIQQLVFSYSIGSEEEGFKDRLSVLKITASSTQTSVFKRLQLFMQSETHEVMLIVINMQYSTAEIVNHLRIMIEEAEIQFCNSEENKLFVVLLHFPPEMFFNHCYPSLFLSGWDHYYLDTIAPPEEKGVIDICEWFSHCCGAINSKNPAEFLHTPLQELMDEAIPALAAQFSMADIMPSDQVVVGSKIDMLKSIFQTDLGKIVRERFISYWEKSVITEVSEQAANYPHMYESTLSITDAILTIVKSSFYDFLFYVLSTLRKQCVLGPLSQYQQNQEDHELIQLSFDLFRSYPLPKTLPHLKAASMSEIHAVHDEDTNYMQRCRYPFFSFISSLLENLMDQCKMEVNTTDSEELLTEEETRKKLCDIAEERLAKATEIQDIKSLNIALQAMENSDKLWSRYFETLMVSKFSLRKDSSQSIKVLSNLFVELRTLHIHRRVIELHAYIRCCGLDSKLLAVLRFVDSMHRKSRSMSNALDKTSIVPYFHGENKLERLSLLLIDSLYKSVYDVCQEGTAIQSSDILGEMSSYYHAMILVPAMKKMFSTVSECGREKLNVLHAMFLVYNSGMSEATTAIAVDLFRLLNYKVSSQEFSQTLSLKSVVECTVHVMRPNSTVLEAINLPAHSAIHYVLKGLFRHFLPTQSDDEDLRWLFYIANNPSVMQTPYSSPTARCIRQCVLLTLTGRKYDQSCREQDILDMLLDQKSLELQVLGSCLAGPCENSRNSYVPVHYLQCRSLLQPKVHLVEQPLAHLYSSLILEAFRGKDIPLTHILRLHDYITKDSDEQSLIEEILQNIAEQTIIQFLIETLAKRMVTNKDIFQELSEVLDRSNFILTNRTGGKTRRGSHGLMLCLQLLKAHQSSKAFYEAMTIKFNELCGDFKCLHPLNKKLLQSKEIDITATKRQKIFPFVMMSGANSFEQRLYAEISKLLVNLYKSPTRMKQNVLKLVDRCYSGAEEVEFGRKIRNKFNMLLWLCVYQEFYCKKIRRKSAFIQVLKDNLTQYMEPEYLQLILMFAGFDHSVQHHNTTKTEPKSLKDLYQPQWRDQYADLGDTIAYLIATLLGSCDYPCHLHKHAFAPEQLLGTYVPGTMRYDVPVGNEIFYNECIYLATTEFLPGIQHLASKSTCTMSLHCYYFTHWANYAALCISHLINPHAADMLFSDSFDVHQHCFTSMLDVWNMMCHYLQLTVERRFDLINSCFERVYTYDFETDVMTNVKQVNQFEYDWNKLFSLAWTTSTETNLRRPFLSYSTEIDGMFSLLDKVFPVHANPTDFFLQLFSSSFIDEKDGSLHILYQFILHRAKLNAGGKLLPELVQFYRWIHNELNYTVTFDDANLKDVTIEEMLNLYLDKHYLGKEKEKIIALFKAVTDKYQVYRDAVGQCHPQFTVGTPLVYILSTPNGKDILYYTIEQIVNSFNKFLDGMKFSTVVAQRYYAQMNDTKKQILTEVNEADCCFGTAVKLDDLNELMPLISECCNPIAFTDRYNPLTSVDPTILACCVPQLFDFVELQEDIICTYVAGKCLLQSPQQIRMPFNFKEQSKPLNLPGNLLEGAVFQIAPLHRLPHVFQAELDEEILKRTEFECHSMTYYTLLEVTIGLRNAASYLLKEGGNAMNCQQQTLSEFITTVAPGTKDVLSHLGVQTKRVYGLTKSQCNYLQSIKLVHLYETLKLLVEWLELGMYDFCSLSFAMKVHLTNESKHHLHRILMSSHGLGVSMPIKSMQGLKCLQTLLVRSESLLRNAMHTNLTKPLKDILPVTHEMMETSTLVKECLTDDLLVCHYVHLRIELRRLNIELQNAIGKDVINEHALSKRWDDWVKDIWETLDYDRHNSPNSSMTVPLDPGVTYYPHEGKWGLQMDSIDTDLHNLVERKNHIQTQQLDRLKESSSVENVHDDNFQPDIMPMEQDRTVLLKERSDKEHALKLARKDTRNDLAEFLKSIDMEEFVENVIESHVTGDMAIGELGEDIMAEQGMSPVTFIRFCVLYRRHLLQQTSELGKKCPVEKVIEFFEQYSVLEKHVMVIADKCIDGEMLLEALNSEAASSELRQHLTATGWALIQRNFTGFVGHLA